MRLDLRTSADDVFVLPLACDPDVREANEATRLVQYRWQDSDAEGLKIPEGATLVEARALSRPELRAADRKAGRRSARGEQLRARQYAAIADAVTAAETDCKAAIEADREGGAEIPDDEAADRLRRATSEASGAASAAFVDALTDEDYGALVAYGEWLEAHSREVVRQSVRRVTAGPGEADIVAGPEGFNVEAFELACTHVLAARDEIVTGIDVVTEIAEHVRRVSTLGKGGLPCSAWPCGPLTTTPPAGAGIADNAGTSPD